ncbi:MAG: NAD(P)H-hydrate epimerase [Planctomycetota bacterium]|nr:MAG: NAD(P)H-hydrate epimerase [Planctomycetota bacterium]
MDDATMILSRAQVREVDRIAIDEYGMPGIALMENAGASAARLLRELAPDAARVAIVCGRGNNGGDGFVVARHLQNAGRKVTLLLVCDPAALGGDAAVNYAIVKRMGLEMHPFASPNDMSANRHRLSQADVIVDALLGTGFAGTVKRPFDQVIEEINAAGRPVFALDLPSGLDCDTGQPSNATVRAAHTITFVAKKPGFLAPAAAAWVGRVHVADIGCPAEIIQRVRSPM